MTRRSFATFCVAIALCVSCAHRSRSPSSPAAAGAANRAAALPTAVTGTSPPATQPSAPLLFRPTVQWQWVLDNQRDYLAAEGLANRGKLFEILTWSLARLFHPPTRILITMKGPGTTRPSPQSLTELQVLAILGPPDYGAWGQLGAKYAWLYDREAKKDACVVVEINERGLVESFEWNEAKRAPLTQMRPYSDDPAAEPAPHLALGDAYLGVAFDPVTWQRDGQTYTISHGVRITQIIPNSPAAGAGLQPGDVIERLDGQVISERDFRPLLAKHRRGDVVKLKIVHGQEPQAESYELLVTLDAYGRQAVAPAPATRLAPLSQAQAVAIALKAANSLLPPDAGWKFDQARAEPKRSGRGWSVIVRDSKSEVRGRQMTVIVSDDGTIEKVDFSE